MGFGIALRLTELATRQRGVLPLEALLNSVHGIYPLVSDHSLLSRLPGPPGICEYIGILLSLRLSTEIRDRDRDGLFIIDQGPFIGATLHNDGIVALVDAGAGVQDHRGQLVEDIMT